MKGDDHRFMNNANYSNTMPEIGAESVNACSLNTDWTAACPESSEFLLRVFALNCYMGLVD